MADKTATNEELATAAPEDQLIRLSVADHKQGGLIQRLFTISSYHTADKPAPELIRDCDTIGTDQVFESIVNLYECQNGVYRVERCDEDEDPSTGVVFEYKYRLVLVEAFSSQDHVLYSKRVPAPRPGWRVFVCGVCRSVHILAAAEFLSKTVEVCSCCQAEMTPQRGWADSRVLVNKQGDLAISACIRTLGDFEAHAQEASGTWIFHMVDDQENLKAKTELEAHRETLSKLQVGFVEFIVEEVATGEEVRRAWAEGTAHKVLDEIELDFSCHVSESGMDREPDADIEDARFKYFEKELDRRYPPDKETVPV